MLLHAYRLSYKHAYIGPLSAGRRNIDRLCRYRRISGRQIFYAKIICFSVAGTYVRNICSRQPCMLINTVCRQHDGLYHFNKSAMIFVWSYQCRSDVVENSSNTSIILSVISNILEMFISVSGVIIFYTYGIIGKCM